MLKNDEPPEGGDALAVGAGRQFPDGAYYAKTIFDRHGIASTDRSRVAQQVLGLAYSAAHRRVRGQTPWAFEEMAALAEHYGETLDEVFIAAAKTSAETATLVAGELRVKCQLWVGDEVLRPAPGSILAVRDGSRWIVISSSNVPDGARCFEVRQALLEPNAVNASRIAVLDDQPSITESLCVFLRQAGFKADGFHTIDALRSATSGSTFDAYVLDWVVGNETVGALVEEIRGADPTCPVAILTGKANERGEVVSDIADLVAKHDVRYFSKPLDPHMITAVLSRLIAAHSRV